MTADRSGRARALPPEERRAAIVAATIPLLSTFGTTVTTRQIAEAAGVAEGTIFRVFADKDELIDAAVEAALDTGPLNDALLAIDPYLPFEDRLEEAVRLLQVRTAEIWPLLSAVGRTAPAKDRLRQFDLPGLVALFADEQSRLRFDPVVTARVLRGLVMATSHPAIVGQEPMQSTSIVEVFLDGARTASRKPVSSRG